MPGRSTGGTLDATFNLEGCGEPVTPEPSSQWGSSHWANCDVISVTPHAHFDAGLDAELVT